MSSHNPLTYTGRVPASTQRTGVAQFNPSDFSVHDGVVSTKSGGFIKQINTPEGAVSANDSGVIGLFRAGVDSGIQVVGGPGLATINLKMQSPFGGNFEFVSIIEDEPIELTVNNTFDDPLAHAAIGIVQENDAAGDPYLYWDVEAQASFSLGIVNDGNDYPLQLSYSNVPEPPGGSGFPIFQATATSFGVQTLFQTDMGRVIAVRTVNATGNIFSSDHYVGCLAADITLSLPAVAEEGQVFYIKDQSGNALADSITINVQEGGLIDGGNSVSISTDYGFVKLIFASTQYWTI